MGTLAVAGRMPDLALAFCCGIYGSLGERVKGKVGIMGKGG
jgi:hypothetical protein